MKKARHVFTREGKKSLFVSDVLAKINFRVAESSRMSEYDNFVDSVSSEVYKTKMTPKLVRTIHTFPTILRDKEISSDKQ